MSVLLSFGFHYVVELCFITLDAIINPICPKTVCYGVENYPLLFDQAVSRVGNRIYDLENYNCVDFSQDLVEELEEIGIKSSIAIDKDRTHAWVVIWIEATTGDFVLVDEDLGMLELRDKDMNVICE